MSNENKNNQFNEEPGNFGLPEGYFQKSASSVMNKIEWMEEHKDFPKLVAIKDGSGFVVPENYFLKNEQKLELIQYPSLSSVQNTNTFSVPRNYFEEIETLEFTKIFGEDKEELDAFDKLRSLKKQNTFIIPENYFSTNAKRLTDLIQPEQTKIIFLFSRRVAYALAAMLLVVTGVWIYNFYSVPVTVEDCGTIACLDKQDLVKTKNLERLEDEELYELVDPAALKRKLEDPGLKGPGMKENKDSSLNEISAEDLLDDI